MNPLVKFFLWFAAASVVALFIAAYMINHNDDSPHVNESTGLIEGTDPYVNNPGSDDPTPTKKAKRSYEFDGHGANVDRTMFGKAWPLTLADGRVNCVVDTAGNVAVVFTSDDNKRYGLNGVAKAQAETWGYLPLEDIWAPNPSTGAKKDIGVLIDVCAPMMK